MNDERISLSLDGHPAGDCAKDDFEITKIYLREKAATKTIVDELEKAGYSRHRAITIIVNAKRELESETREQQVDENLRAWRKRVSL